MNIDVLERFSAQIGEIAWHTFTIDKTINSVSQNHYEKILPYLKKHNCRRFLEIACYTHFSGHLIHNEDDSIESTLCDISTYSLINGKKACLDAGFPANAKLVASDFHELPFENNSFDLVFISSAVHHTLTPHKVLEECLRVLDADGVLFVFNEPCQRAFSFNKFRTNRRSDFTDLEKYLDKNGLLRTITSFFFQGRPEMLFDMVENDSIPLSTYEDFFKYGELLEYSLKWRDFISDFDSAVIDKNLPEQELANFIVSELSKRLEGAKITKREEMMGMMLPTFEEIENKAKVVAKAICEAPSSGLPRDVAMTNLFGGAIRFVLKKKVATLEKNKIKCDLFLLDGVFVKPLRGDGYLLRIDQPQMPNIQTCEIDKLRQHYLLSDWKIDTTNTNVALVATCIQPRVHLPSYDCSVLVIRMFTPFQGNPYKIKITSGEFVLEEIIVANPESRLIKKVIRAEYVKKICFEFSDLTDIVLPSQVTLRIPVFQLIPVMLAHNRSVF